MWTHFFFSFIKADSFYFNFDFSLDNDQWRGDFVDYPVGEEAFYQLQWGWQNLPQPLYLKNDKLTKGLWLSGVNHSDDLFMFVKRQIKGLMPNTFYSINFFIILESNVAPHLMGIGGSPGESVYLKVGASSVEPIKINHEGFYQLNIDKGNQSAHGQCTQVIGNLGNPLVDALHPSYEAKELKSCLPVKAQSDAEGNLWLFVGTDSGYEGLTSYYLAQITATANSD